MSKIAGIISDLMDFDSIPFAWPRGNNRLHYEGAACLPANWTHIVPADEGAGVWVIAGQANTECLGLLEE